MVVFIRTLVRIDPRKFEAAFASTGGDQIAMAFGLSALSYLALTGYDTLQNELRIKKAGADAYLAKPFDVEKFREELSKLIHRRERKSSV